MEFNVDDYIYDRTKERIGRVISSTHLSVEYAPLLGINGNCPSTLKTFSPKSSVEPLTINHLKQIKGFVRVEIYGSRELALFDKALDYTETTYQYAMSYAGHHKEQATYAILNNDAKHVTYCQIKSANMYIPAKKILLNNEPKMGLDLGQGKDHQAYETHYYRTAPFINNNYIATVKINDKYADVNDAGIVDLSGFNLKFTIKKEEENKMTELKTLDTKKLSKLIIDEDNRKVTALCNEGTPYKKATVAVQSKDDTFDKYVGAAVAIAYQFFGSKAEFRKFVDEKAQDLKKIAEEKAAKKKQHLEELEKAKAKKAEREAKKKELPEPTDEQIAAFIKKIFGKEYKKQIKKSK